MSRAIETKEFEFPAKDYFRLALRGQIKATYWLYAYLIVGLIFLSLAKNDFNWGVFIVLTLLIVIPIVSYLKIWFLAQVRHPCLFLEIFEKNMLTQLS